METETSVGVSAVVLKATEPTTAVGGLYLLRTDGELYAYDGSPTFAQTYANTTPVADLRPASYVNPNLLQGTQAPPSLYLRLSELMEPYSFGPVGYQFAGATAYVLSSAAWDNSFGNPYYLLRHDGALFAYDGPGSYAHTFTDTTPLATVSPAVFNLPSLLLSATSPLVAVGATATVTGGALALGAPGSFVGSFLVTVSATDGVKATTEAFVVNSTDTPPVPNAVAGQSVSKSAGPVQLTVGAADAENDPVSFQAQAVGYSADHQRFLARGRHGFPGPRDRQRQSRDRPDEFPGDSESLNMGGLTPATPKGKPGGLPSIRRPDGVSDRDSGRAELRPTVSARQGMGVCAESAVGDRRARGNSSSPALNSAPTLKPTASDPEAPNGPTPMTSKDPLRARASKEAPHG